MRPPEIRTSAPSSILDALDPRKREELLVEGHRRRYASGDVLFREGTRSSSVVLLQRGRVKVTSISEDGHEIVLAIRGRGDVLGELGVLDGSPRSATVTAMDEVEAVIVPAGRFRGLLERDGRLALAVLRTVVGRLRDADRKRVEFGALDVPARVALRLLELADRYGRPSDDGMRITVRLTQEELAGWVGSSREAVVKALRTFRERGWVDTGRRQLTILDEEALRRHAGSER